MASALTHGCGAGPNLRDSIVSVETLDEDQNSTVMAEARHAGHYAAEMNRLLTNSGHKAPFPEDTSGLDPKLMLDLATQMPWYRGRIDPSYRTDQTWLENCMSFAEHAEEQGSGAEGQPQASEPFVKLTISIENAMENRKPAP